LSNQKRKDIYIYIYSIGREKPTHKDQKRNIKRDNGKLMTLVTTTGKRNGRQQQHLGGTRWWAVRGGVALEQVWALRRFPRFFGGGAAANGKRKLCVKITNDQPNNAGSANNK